MNDPENASNEGLSYKKDHYLNFEEFWPYYLSQHRDVRCRMTHFGGVSAAATLVVLGLFFAQPFWILLAVLAGYGWAFFGHFQYEKNKPASFKNPVYSFFADFRMFWLTLQGDIDAEFQRFSILAKR